MSTHKKQDEELREKIQDIILTKLETSIEFTDGAQAYKLTGYQEAIDAVVYLITERDKNIANEARIDELNSIYSVWHRRGGRPVGHVIKGRLAELEGEKS